jgi:peroxiredoxin
MQDIRIKILLILPFLVLNVSGFAQKTVPAKEITVYVFLSETCPICQSYTLTLKTLHAKYKPHSVKFIGVFPNYYSDEKGLAAFKKKYAIPFDLIIDKKKSLTNSLKANITPEVFVVDGKKNILYSGRIDDSFYAVGKRRNIITSNDLETVLEAIVSGQKIKISKTQAVGCIITSSD